jgi:hypothetical protein
VGARITVRFQVQPGDVAGGQGLGQGGVGLLDLGRALLGALGGDQLAQGPVADQLAAGLGQGGPGGGDIGVGLAQGQGVALAVDIEQRLAGLDRLVVGGVDRVTRPETSGATWTTSARTRPSRVQGSTW